MMNRLAAIKKIREKLGSGGCSIGSWMQIPNSSVAEIMGHAGYDWIAIDMEHGAISVHQLPDIFRALELGATLPLVRVARGHSKDCKLALDAGAGGVIVPMIDSAEQLENVIGATRWPPAGRRGVAFSRANLFGKKFGAYAEESQQPLLIAMIESFNALKNIDSILKVDGLDAILIGPYDLSCSMGIPGQFENDKFIEVMEHIRDTGQRLNCPAGLHIVEPDVEKLEESVIEGYIFIAYSVDSRMLDVAAREGINKFKHIKK